MGIYTYEYLSTLLPSYGYLISNFYLMSETPILFQYNDVNIISRKDREDGMVELTSDSGGTYVVFPEEITL